MSNSSFSWWGSWLGKPKCGGITKSLVLTAGPKETDIHKDEWIKL